MNETLTMKERMLLGLPYKANDEHLTREYIQCAKRLKSFNNLGSWQKKELATALQDILGAIGSNGTINPPFHCDYGGNITIGENFFANYGLTILDVAPVKIGHHVMMGPHVGLYTAGHPMHPDPRNAGHEWGLPIVIGDNVWIGGHVVVNPGISIGSNTVVGAGSVVTKNMPEWVFCAGNPCRVIREIMEDDLKYYRKNLEWPTDFIN